MGYHITKEKNQGGAFHGCVDCHTRSVDLAGSDGPLEALGSGGRLG